MFSLFGKRSLRTPTFIPLLTLKKAPGFPLPMLISESQPPSCFQFLPDLAQTDLMVYPSLVFYPTLHQLPTSPKHKTFKPSVYLGTFPIISQQTPHPLSLTVIENPTNLLPDVPRHANVFHIGNYFNNICLQFLCLSIHLTFY